MSEDKFLLKLLGGLGLLIAVLIAVLVTIKYHCAAHQARVWQRQGVEITQWEVFMDAKPIQKLMTEASP